MGVPDKPQLSLLVAFRSGGRVCRLQNRPGVLLLALPAERSVTMIWGFPSMTALLGLLAGTMPVRSCSGAEVPRVRRPLR